MNNKEFMIGYLPVDELVFKKGFIDYDYLKLHLKKGIKESWINLFDKSLIIRKSANWNIVSKDVVSIDYELKQQMVFVTNIMIKQLKDDDLIEGIVLVYKIQKDLLDMQIVCGAFENPEELFIIPITTSDEIPKNEIHFVNSDDKKIQKIINLGQS